MRECHAKRCEKVATLAVRFKNSYSFKDRPTRPLFYCDDHAATVAGSFEARGLRPFIEPVGGDQ